MYLDTEVDSFEPPKRIISLQYKWLDHRDGPLRILTQWDLGSEEAILNKFEEETRFFSLKWKAVPVGFNLDFDLPLLQNKATAYGHLEWGKPWNKPRIDLMQIALLMNMDAVPPEDARGELPNCFYGASLDKFSTKRGRGAAVPQLFRDKRYADIEAYARQEAFAFEDLFGALRAEAPKWWKGTIAPMLGVDTRAPKRR